MLIERLARARVAPPSLSPRQENSMRHLALAFLMLAALPASATEWNGAGELGLALARGNAESDTLNAKLDLKKDDERWLYEVNAAALRASGEVDVVEADGSVGRDKVTNASRWQLGGKAGYKYNDRMYFFGAVRYDNDDFAPYEWQAIVSAGVGYKFIDSETTKFSGEAGPGWRRTQPIDVLVEVPAPPRLVEQDAESDAVLRGTLAYEHKLSETTTLVDNFLVEAGSDKTFLQNELGVQVQINESLALKSSLQVRHNTETTGSTEKTDTLLTTNIVVGF
jgi:putative salt-induced outer membrane protein